jgi:hypothetical protein
MVEPQIVVLDVAGSSPVGHPTFSPQHIRVPGTQSMSAADILSTLWGGGQTFVFIVFVEKITFQQEQEDKL